MLYFDYGTDASTGSLHRLADGSFELTQSFEEGEEVRVERRPFASFESFWEDLARQGHLAFVHPLFVHPEARPFVSAQVGKADFSAEGDARWQGSHRRQWNKVLEAPSTYYGG